MNPLLQISNLNIIFSMPDKDILAVRELSLRIKKGETLGLVGESGCGKSVTAFSILRLISPTGKIESGEILFNDRDLCSITEDEMRSVRGKEIAIIFQEPMTSLNPAFKIGYQISETIRLHLNKTKKEAMEMAVELLDQMGIPSPDKRYNSYAHELSGGMRQRVMIAMALSGRPSMLIADEPTTALDVTIQAQILELLLNIQKERDMSLLLITHDLGIIANTADNIAIMYAGEIAEYGTVKEIFGNPLHPYTIGLFNAIPKIGESKERLSSISGVVPVITEKPEECIFYDRCFKKSDECNQNPVSLEEKEKNHYVRCIRV